MNIFKARILFLGAILVLTISCKKKEIDEKSIYFYNNSSDTLLLSEYLNSNTNPKHDIVYPFDNSVLVNGDDFEKTPSTIFKNKFDSIIISKNSDNIPWVKFYSDKAPYNYYINPASNYSAWIFKGTTQGGQKTNFTTTDITYYNYWFELK
jgi:hypothetical protein